MHPDLLNNAGVALILAMGIPLAQLIFGTKANLGLILLPIMFYHPFQLFVCGLLANSFANIKETNMVRPIAVGTEYGRLVSDGSSEICWRNKISLRGGIFGKGEAL